MHVFILVSFETSFVNCLNVRENAFFLGYNLNVRLLPPESIDFQCLSWMNIVQLIHTTGS